MAAEILRACVDFEREAAIHDAHLQIAEPPSASFWRFGLAVGTHNGTAAGPAGLTLSGTLAPGVYTDIYGTGAPRDIAYHSGEWLSEAFTAPFDFDELVASWNATTPDGTWIK